MEKPKKRTPGMNTWLFLGLWALAYAVGWGGAALVSIERIVRQWFNLSGNWEPLLFAFPLALLIGGTQRLLARRAFGLNLRYWVRATLAGWVLSGGILVWMLENLRSPGAHLIFGTYYLLPALAQWLILRKHVRSAWLWVLAGVASAFTFVVVLPLDVTGLTVAFAGSLQGLVTALSMRWLVTIARQQPLKAKPDTSRLADTAQSDSADAHPDAAEAELSAFG